MTQVLYFPEFPNTASFLGRPGLLQIGGDTACSTPFPRSSGLLLCFFWSSALACPCVSSSRWSRSMSGPGLPGLEWSGILTWLPPDCKSIDEAVFPRGFFCFPQYLFTGAKLSKLEAGIHEFLESG